MIKRLIFENNKRLNIPARKQVYFQEGSDMQVEVTIEQRENTGADTLGHDDYKRECWAKRRERFLAIANQAKAAHDYLRVGRAFVLVPVCESQMNLPRQV